MTTFFAADSRRPQPRLDRDATPFSRWSWLWITLACSLLAASGLLRAWQDHNFEAAKDRVIKPLFPLKDLPTQFGSWQVKEGAEAALDPQISRTAGAVDSLIRTYVDKPTGVAVTVLILYGTAETVSLHVPEACYPSSGYKAADDAYEVNLASGDTPISLLNETEQGKVPRFRSLVFLKESGALADREEVYYSLRHDDRWTPTLPGNWRTLRYSPPVFKIQTQRLICDHEHRNVDNPTEQFLIAFVKDLEARIQEAQTRARKTRSKEQESPEFERLAPLR